MTSLRLQLSLLFLFPVALLLGNTISASADDAVLKNGYTDPPLTDFLNPDGSLNVTPGFSGQIDIAGYHLYLDECAGPVAVPDGMASATGTWGTLGSGTNGEVNTIVAAANGDLYVGGSFTEAGGITANRIAKWDGTNWSALGSGLGGTCNAIAIATNGDVYAGGLFSTAGGATVDDIAVWDGTNWNAVGSGSSVFSCRALAFASDGTLYAGGSWVNIGGVRSFSIASWDGSSWSALGAGLANSSGTIGVCLDIAIAPDGSVYAAGEFATAGGTPALNIAKWDGTSWSALGSGINDRVNGIDFASDGTLYATGDFTEAGGSPAGAIAKWDGTSWSALGSGLGFTGFDFGLGIKAASDGNVYVVGQFNLSSGGGSSSQNVAKWDGTNWSGVGTGLSSFTYDVAESPSGDIYVGGSFGADNGFPSVTLNRIARLIPPVPCDIAITSVDKTDETCPGEDDGSITINATCSSCASILYSIDGGTTTQTSPTFSGLTPGTYQPYVEDSGDDTCTDAAADETIADGIDSEAPSISCPGTITTAGLGANCQKALSDYTSFVTASDNCDTELTLSQSPAAGTIITGEQDLVVTVTATDNANLMNSCTYTVPLRDITFPEIDCPENVIVQATAATCTPIVNDIEATASDNCTVNPDISYTTTGATVTSGSGSAMLSGTSFSVGGTIVTYTATDDAMQPNEANCSFIITVQDNTDCGCGNPQPGDSCDDGDSETDNDVIQDDCSCAGTSCDIAITSVNETDETCPGEGDGSITINATCNSCDGILYSIDGGATTQASPTFTGLMPDSYQPYVVDSGDNTCSDAVTNLAIGTQADTEDPTAICPTIPNVTLTENGIATLPANIGQGLSTDNCGNPSESSPMLSFDCDDLGPQTVTLTADDGNGNTDTEQCSFMVTLPDGLPNGWTASDIGDQDSDYSFDPCVPGPTDYNISTDGYHLIPNTSDNMAFASLPLCGNGGIQARIEDVEGGYAGLMIRESSAPGAKMTAIYSNLTNLLRRETRYTTNGARSSGLINAAFPTMLRLVRQGDWIRGFYKNSSQWVLFHQVYLPMDECVEMGLAVFSTDPFGTATATFDKVNFMSGMNLSAPNTGPIADALADVQRARIAPNPTSGAFTLDFERPLEIAATAVLRNELGQALQQLKLPAGAVNHNFDGSNLPRGLYFLEVRDAQGYREVLKVVRQ